MSHFRRAVEYEDQQQQTILTTSHRDHERSESPTNMATVRPDQEAFDGTTSINKNKRQKKLSPAQQATYPPGTPGSLYQFAEIPISFSASHGRCPSTPMKGHSYQSFTTPHSLNNSRGRTNTGGFSNTNDSFNSSLASSHGSSELDHSITSSIGTPDFNYHHQHHHPSSPLPPVSAMKLNSNGHSNSLSSSFGRHHELHSDVPPSRFATQFIDLGTVGVGSFAVVRRARDKLTGVEYAVKESLQPLKGSNDRAMKMREVEHLQCIRDTPRLPENDDHKHWIRYFDAWEEPDHSKKTQIELSESQGVRIPSKLYIQTDLLLGGTVEEFLGDKSTRTPLPNEFLWLFLLDMCRGLRFLHDRCQLAHFDLKPENTFLSIEENGECILKIGDLGRSRSLKQLHARSLALQRSEEVSGDIEEGDKVYLAPEVLAQAPTIGAPADIFSLGLMLLEGACGGIADEGNNWEYLRKNDGSDPQWAQRVWSDAPAGLDQSLKHLFTSMLALDPMKRPTAADILADPAVALACNNNGALSSARAELRRFAEQHAQQQTKMHISDIDTGFMAAHQSQQYQSFDPHSVLATPAPSSLRSSRDRRYSSGSTHSTPTSLNHQFAAAAVSVPSVNDAPMMMEDLAASSCTSSGSNSFSSNGSGSSDLFSSSSYSSRSSFSEAADESAYQRQKFEFIQRQQQQQQQAQSHPPIDMVDSIRALTQSTRRTASFHTERHAVKGLHSIHLQAQMHQNMFPQQQQQQQPIQFSMQQFQQHQQQHTPSFNSRPFQQPQQHSAHMSDVDSDMEDHTPQRNLLSAFADADDD